MTWRIRDALFTPEVSLRKMRHLSTVSVDECFVVTVSRETFFVSSRYVLCVWVLILGAVSAQRVLNFNISLLHREVFISGDSLRGACIVSCIFSVVPACIQAVTDQDYL